ncbi:hypothetical protein FVEG_08335 [Fusarium verticillioides 7600]|uniref:Transcription factor domain-containing protein n=1 Tax=Gibberella moniliformis (strain M3125 / FGSC 7600) TaxID=334819 RepID=W7MCA8_GIBM7|nr:hypothetical protein FVEG_08335 [Fusarium verticillioides 7600]EWG48631.1 hypothetical protein FVEG_08335 [Fusarium verticillioides 7600]
MTKPSCSNCTRNGLDWDGYTLRFTWLPASVGTGDNPQRPKRTVLPKKNTSPLSAETNTAASVSHLGALIGNGANADDAHLRRLLTDAADHRESSRGFLLLCHEEYLLNHFNRCVHRHLMHLMGTWLTDLLYHPYLEPALMAISASNLFQESVFRRDPTMSSCHIKERHTDTMTQSCFRLAINYYNDAIRTISDTTSNGNKSPQLNLAMTLLLVLFEWESGSVHGSFVHMDGADAIVLSSFEELCQTSTGRLLLKSWADMRARKNRQKLAFRPLEIELSRASDTRDRVLMSHARQFSSGVASALTNAISMRDRLVLHMCAACDGIDESLVLSHFRQWYSHAFDFNYTEELSSEVGNVLTTNELIDGLDATQKVLHGWRNGLDESQLPVLQAPSHSGLDRISEDRLVLVGEVAPLQFRTPEAAFNYLRYAVSLVITSPQVLSMYVLATRPRAPRTHIPAVVAHLLSVIEGLDPAQLIRYDVYDSGPLWALVTLALCVPESHVVSWILETILPRYEKYSHRGSMLISFIDAKEMLLCIQSQLQKGILPLLCSSSSVITEDLISSPVARFGQKFAIISRNTSGIFSRIITSACY